MRGTMMQYPLVLTSLFERAGRLFAEADIVSRAMHLLTGIGLIGLHNADAVIAELVMGSRQFDLRHMAGDAIVS